MDTAAACRTYNVLVSEGRSVVAALLLERAEAQPRSGPAAPLPGADRRSFIIAGCACQRTSTITTPS